MLLFVLGACRSKRQASEIIAMSQRQWQQVLYHDTLWQSLSLRLDDVSFEWHSDSLVGSKGVNFHVQAERAELNACRQAHTEVQTVTHYSDTLVANWQSVEVTPSQNTSSVSSHVWSFVLLGGALAVAGCCLFYRIKKRIL